MVPEVQVPKVTREGACLHIPQDEVSLLPNPSQCNSISATFRDVVASIRSFLDESVAE